MDRIHNLPDFKYIPRVEKQGHKQDGKQNQEEQKKKKKDDKSGSLFESLADRLGQYSDEPFQFNG